MPVWFRPGCAFWEAVMAVLATRRRDGPLVAQILLFLRSWHRALPWQVMEAGQNLALCGIWDWCSFWHHQPTGSLSCSSLEEGSGRLVAMGPCRRLRNVHLMPLKDLDLKIYRENTSGQTKHLSTITTHLLSRLMFRPFLF